MGRGPPKHDARRNMALRLLRTGQITVAVAVTWCGVSKQRIHQWCDQHGVDPVQANRERMAALLVREDAKIRRKQKRNQ